METAPRNCRFLPLVVVERALIKIALKILWVDERRESNKPRRSRIGRGTRSVLHARELRSFVVPEGPNLENFFKIALRD